MDTATQRQPSWRVLCSVPAALLLLFGRTAAGPQAGGHRWGDAHDRRARRLAGVWVSAFSAPPTVRVQRSRRGLSPACPAAFICASSDAATRPRRLPPASRGRDQHDMLRLSTGALRLSRPTSPVMDDFPIVADALSTYRAIHGNLRIAPKFVVPEGDPAWPEDVWGMQLGRRVAKLRTERSLLQSVAPDRVALLSGMGFEWSEQTHGLDEWDRIRMALETYRSEYRHLKVPARFIVPDEAPWPEATRGLRLGSRVGAIRNSDRFIKDHEERRAILDKMGFEWQVARGATASAASRSTRKSTTTAGSFTSSVTADETDVTDDDVIAAVVRDGLAADAKAAAATAAAGAASSRLNGDSSAAAAATKSLLLFEGEETAEEEGERNGSGLLLAGSGSGLLSAGDAELARRAAAAAQALADREDGEKDRGGNDDKMVQRAAAAAAGTPLPPPLQSASTTAAAASSSVSSSSAGRLSTLSTVAQAMQAAADRDATAVERAAREDAAGTAPEAFELVLEALEVYGKLNGHVNVPVSFVVPRQAPWPMRVWGLPLGSRCVGMRGRGLYVSGNATRQAMLRAVGFETEADMRNAATETKFQKIVGALEVYRALHGNINVPQSFIAPASEPWPREYWKMNLGQRVANIRNQGTFVKANPQRRDLLDRMGFAWSASEDPDKPKRGRRKRADIQAAAAAEVAAATEAWDREAAAAAAVAAAGSGRSAAAAAAAAWGRGNGKGSGNEFGNGNNGGGGNPQSLLDSLVENLRDDGSGSGLGSGAAAAGGRMTRQQQQLMQQQGQGAGLLSQPPPPLPPGRFSVAAAAAFNGQLQGLGPPPGLPTGLGGLGAFPPPSWAEGASGPSEIIMEERGLAPYSSPHPAVEDWPQEQGLEAARKHMSMLGSKSMGGNAQLASRATTPFGALSNSPSYSPSAIPLGRPGDSSSFPSPFNSNNNNGNSGGSFYSSQAATGSMYDGSFGSMDSANSAARSGRALPRGVNMASFNWMTEEERDMVGRYGFEWDEFGNGFSFEQVLEGLTHYKKLYEDLRVPEDFIVVFDYEWPSELAGLALGPICQQLRRGDIWGREDDERRAALDDLGFDWGPLAFTEDDPYLYFQWDEVLCGLFAHKIIRGDACVSAEWVVPDVDPWPLPLRGLPLGFLVNLVRWQRDVLQVHYPDRYQLVEAMGFMWLPPVFQEWEGLEVEGVATGARRGSSADSLQRVASARANKEALEAPETETDRFEELSLLEDDENDEVEAVDGDELLGEEDEDLRVGLEDETF